MQYGYIKMFTVKFIRKLLVNTIFIYSRLHLFTILEFVCNVCKLFAMQNVTFRRACWDTVLPRLSGLVGIILSEI